MADLPLLGVPAASSPPPPPEPLPTFSPAARRTLLVLSALALALLAWRGYGMTRYGTRPAELRREVVPLSPLDLNHATRAELASVPGLGETLAARVVLHREAHGDFRSVDELRKVSGIGPKTLERIRPFLQVGTYTEAAVPVPVANVPGPAKTKKPPPTEKVDINRASAAELQKLPGIGPMLAGRIVEARAKKSFASVEELRKVKGIGAKTMDKLRPHVTTGGHAEP